MKFKVLLVSDGWDYMHESTKKYIKNMYKDVKLLDELDDDNITYVLESDEKIKFHDDTSLDITTVLKRDNRKKVNNHEWFFGKNGFGDHHESTYMLGLDAYTLLFEDSLYNLIKHLKNNKDCIACSGRLLTREITENYFSNSNILKDTQYYNYEYSNLTFNGILSYIGFLPVIPGACAFFKSKHLLKDKVRNYYFDMYKQENKSSLVMDNMKIVEDRILSCSLLFNNDSYDCKTQIAPDVFFNVNHEMTLRGLILQRRRWNNGSFFTFFYYILSLKTFYNWNASLLRKSLTYIFFVLQFLQALLSYFSVIIIVYIIRISVIFLEKYYFDEKYLKYVESYYGYFVIIFLYYFNTLIHFFQKYNTFYINFLYGFSMILSVVIHLSIFMSTYLFFDFDYLFKYNNIIIVIFYLTYFFPYITLLLMCDFKRLYIFTTKTLFYFLNINLFSMIIPTYSISRFWDLTWGNKPDGDKEKILYNKYNKMKNIVILILFVLLNNFVYLTNIFFLKTFMIVILTVYLFSTLFFQFLSSFYFIFYTNKENLEVVIDEEESLEIVEHVVNSEESIELVEEVDNGEESVIADNAEESVIADNAEESVIADNAEDSIKIDNEELDKFINDKVLIQINVV